MHIKAPLRHLAGSLFILGMETPALGAAEAAQLRSIQPGGVILFRRNIESAAQTHTLLQGLSAVSDQPLFRCIDLEGGTVDRLRNLIAAMPSAAEVASTLKPALYRKHGELIARETRLLGFNTSFAPVLDLALHGALQVMTTRVVSPDPAHVIAYASEFLTGMAEHGALTCGKHFPGLGGGDLDSHQATPVIDRTWPQLWSEDLLPYRKLHRSLDFIMVSHAAYPAASSDEKPASVSKFWITEKLRRKIGYRGIILSDDLEMGGILNQMPIEQACIAAIAAGTDMLEICRSAELLWRGYEAVLREAERSASFRTLVESAARRIQKAKTKFLANNTLSAPPGDRAVSRMRDAILRFTEQVAKSAASAQIHHPRPL